MKTRNTKITDEKKKYKDTIKRYVMVKSERHEGLKRNGKEGQIKGKKGNVEQGRKEHRRSKITNEKKIKGHQKEDYIW